MDKWKDLELEKMKAGGNRKAKDFFLSQPDYRDGMSLQEKYNSKAAALYRDKVSMCFMYSRLPFDINGSKLYS
jgi:ADP-ribosylation factor GTPase-activating protein 1